MSIIIGSGPWFGPDPAGVARTRPGCRDTSLHVGVAGDAPHVAVVVARGRWPAARSSAVVVVAGPEGAAAEVDVVVVTHPADSDRSSDPAEPGSDRDPDERQAADADVRLLERDVERLDGQRLLVPRRRRSPPAPPPCPPPGRRGPAPSRPLGSMPSRPADPPRCVRLRRVARPPTFRAMVRAPPRPPNTAPSRSPAPVTSSSVCFVDCRGLRLADPVLPRWRPRHRARSIFDSKRFARTATCASAPASAATSQRAANSACDSPGRLTSFSSRLVNRVTVRVARRCSTIVRCTVVNRAFVLSFAAGSS